MIRVELPYHLRILARVDGAVEIEIDGSVTRQSVLDAVEAKYPMLRGAIREYGTGNRRPFLRFFGCGEDLSNEPADAPLPNGIATGEEPFMIVGAIAGG